MKCKGGCRTQEYDLFIAVKNRQDGGGENVKKNEERNWKEAGSGKPFLGELHERMFECRGYSV
jgi:hypothetical protein